MRLYFRVQDGELGPDDRLEPSRSKPQQGWKETTLYSVHKGDGQPPITKVFTKSGEGRHPKLSSAFTDRLRPNTAPAQQVSPGAEWPKGKIHYLSYIRPGPSVQAEPQPHTGFSSKARKPDLDRLLLKSGSNRLAPKEHLNAVDGKLFTAFCFSSHQSLILIFLDTP